MENLSSLLVDIALEVYSAIEPIRGSRDASKAVGRGAGGDVTKKIDRVAEDVIVRMLEESEISHILVSEECGVRRFGDARKYYFVADSIDGTTNALRGLPFYCTSLAASTSDHLKDVKAGVIMNLYNKDLFTAEYGKGAYLNDTPIHPSNITLLEEAIIGVDLCRISRLQLQKISNLLLQSKYIRHLGSDALEIANIAAGFTDAFVDIRNRLRITDMAAAYIILKESGGVILHSSGGELDSKLEPTSHVSFVAAANRTLCSKILELLKID